MQGPSSTACQLSTPDMLICRVGDTREPCTPLLTWQKPQVKRDPPSPHPPKTKLWVAKPFPHGGFAWLFRPLLCPQASFLLDLNDHDNDNDTLKEVQPTIVSGLALTGVSEGVMTPRKKSLLKLMGLALARSALRIQCCRPAGFNMCSGAPWS